MKDGAYRVAIVDFGLGNLFSVKHACEHVGLLGVITAAKSEVLAADAVILPGVGAFGDAMDSLQRLDLIPVLRDVAQSRVPLLGICLGIQLLMSESYEFGRHKGLDIIRGTVERFDRPVENERPLKVPQIGWNGIHPARDWSGTLLDGLSDGDSMYFVHSFVAHPEDRQVVLSTSRYGHIEFCSSLALGNIFACQFHPERSAWKGLLVYRNLTKHIQTSRGIQE